MLVNDGLELVKSEAKIRIALIMVNYGYFIPSKGCSLHAYTGAVGIWIRSFVFVFFVPSLGEKWYSARRQGMYLLIFVQRDKHLQWYCLRVKLSFVVQMLSVFHSSRWVNKVGLDIIDLVCDNWALPYLKSCGMVCNLMCVRLYMSVVFCNSCFWYSYWTSDKVFWTCSQGCVMLWIYLCQDLCLSQR